MAAIMRPTPPHLRGRLDASARRRGEERSELPRLQARVIQHAARCAKLMPDFVPLDYPKQRGDIVWLRDVVDCRRGELSPERGQYELQVVGLDIRLGRVHG
jgi:hypothetical protein